MTEPFRSWEKGDWHNLHMHHTSGNAMVWKVEHNEVAAEKQSERQTLEDVRQISEKKEDLVALDLLEDGAPKPVE